MEIIQTIDKTQGLLVKGLAAAATALLFPMMFFVTADVIGRYLLNRPIPGVFEINSNFLMVLVVFFPLAYVHRRQEHVCVTLFTQKLPERIRALLVLFSIVLGLFAFGLIGWYGLEAAVASTRIREYIPGVIRVPIWISHWIIPIGSFAFCLELLLDGLKQVATMVTPSN